MVSRSLDNARSTTARRLSLCRNDESTSFRTPFAVKRLCCSVDAWLTVTTEFDLVLTEHFSVGSVVDSGTLLAVVEDGKGGKMDRK